MLVSTTEFTKHNWKNYRMTTKIRRDKKVKKKIRVGSVGVTTAEVFCGKCLARVVLSGQGVF
jgi:hypothetical protein